jgi:hypothetical protein
MRHQGTGKVAPDGISGAMATLQKDAAPVRRGD